MYTNMDVETAHSSQEFPLGALGSSDGGATIFQYIKFNAGDGAASSAAGQLITGLDGAYPAYEGTNDNNSATIAAILQKPLGFAQCVLADGNFGWVQCWGRSKQDITTDNAVAQGELLMPHATTTGGVDTHDAAAKAVLGVAEEADGVTTSTILDAGDAFITIRSGG